MRRSEAGTQQLHRLLDAITSLGADLELGVVLRRLIEAAVELVDARYGALGVLDPTRTQLSDFITVGLDDAARARIGDLPEGHGILGVLIVDPRPLRLPDLQRHPDSYGFPPDHPPMTSFLGVPVLVGGQAYGNLYLTDKAGGVPFSNVDQDLAVALASAAGTAIEKARLHARARHLDLVEDRERIARDLHDTVIQRLFATGLGLQGAARLAEPLPDVALRIHQAVDELDQVVRQIRSTIFELHGSDTVGEGLRRRVLAVGDDLAGPLGGAPTCSFEGPLDTVVGAALADEVLAVVAEGLTNVARHGLPAAGSGSGSGSTVPGSGSAATVAVRMADGRLEVLVEDRGPGLGPARPGGRGLANLTARAEACGGTCEVGDRPGGGTRVRWVVPLLTGPGRSAPPDP